ncbi:TIGR04500 family putative peptide maturation system protein [Nonomuraea sp. CA-141351]|uniref:TIGR04500 family putative peptide maturation system protein n=1 Tax=Nonomuraea sp. CA-141351 TaxID=3239996 RepID=UPI003D8B0279
MLREALGTLRAVADLEPTEAQERLKDLRERHPHTRFRLLWQREEYDGSLHYDLLITTPGEGTVSLSWCPDRALPWPLRSVHRAGELAFLRVNGVTVLISEVVARLDFLWEETGLMDRLISSALLQQDLQESPVEFAEGELQEAVDAFRRARGLLTAAQTGEWMERRSMTTRDLEELVAGEAAAEHIRRRVTEGRVERYFDEHRDEFGTARIARLTFPDAAAAHRAAGRLAESAEALDVFYTLAESGEARLVIEEVPLTDLQKPAPGDELIRVISVSSAELDASARRRVEQRIFEEWLQERRRTARVEWFWGTTARTSAR